MSISKLPLIVLLALSTQLQAGANGKHGHPKPEPETLPILLENTFTGTVVHRDADDSKQLLSIKIRNGKAVLRIRYFNHARNFDSGLSTLRNNAIVGEEITVMLGCFSVSGADGTGFIEKKRNGTQVRTVYVHYNDFDLCSILSSFIN